MGATFAYTETIVANSRQTNDPLNGAAGGCAAGFLAGIRGGFITCLLVWPYSPADPSTFVTNGSDRMCSIGSSNWRV